MPLKELPFVAVPIIFNFLQKRSSMKTITEQCMRGWWVALGLAMTMFVGCTPPSITSSNLDLVRLQDVALLTDRVLLTKLTKSDTYHTSKIASLRLALMDPLIEGRLGKTKISVQSEELGMVAYGPAPHTIPTTHRYGEVFTVTVSGGNLWIPVTERWDTYFPDWVRSASPGISPPEFLPAWVDISQLLSRLLSRFPQSELAMLAVENGNADVRKAAVGKLTDHALLAKLAVEDGVADVRKAAVEKLTDQAMLAKVAVEDKDEYVRRAAVEKLTDQAVLAKMAMAEDWRGSFKYVAVERLTDQAMLAKVMMEARDGSVRTAAVKKLTDQAVLAKVAVEDKVSLVRYTAVLRMKQLRK